MKIFIILFLLIQCKITNEIYLKPSRIKGDEAKALLQNRLSSIYVNDISTGSNTSLGAAILIPALTGISDDKIYKRRDIENCATKIFLAAIAIDEPQIKANRTKRASDPLRTSDPNSRLIPPLLCQLKEVDAWIDLE